MNANPGASSALAASRKRDLRRSFFLVTLDGIFSIPIGTISLPANVFLVALVTQTFPLPTSTIGLFMALPFIANFLQIFAMPLMARTWPWKQMTVVSAILHLLTWIALAIFLPWLPRDDPTRTGRLLMGWFLISSAFAAVNGVAWNSWIQEWVPARLRGKFFGWRNRFVQFSAVVFLFLTGWVLGHGVYAVATMQGIIAGVAVVRLFSLRCLWINPTRVRQPIDETHRTPRGELAVLLKSSSFLTFVAFGCVWAFATNCFGVFYQVFMFGPMRMSAFDVGITATLAQLGGALSLPIWGQLLDRYGNKPVMIVSLVLWQLPNFLWCFLGPGNRGMLYFIWLSTGATGAGFVLGQFTILLRLIPLEAKSFAIGFNLGITSLFAAVAPIGGGYALEWALARTTDSLGVYHLAFLLQPVLALAGAFLLLRVHEPAASPLAVVVGSMRNIRTLSGVLGLSFLTNYLFLRRPRKGGAA